MWMTRDNDKDSYIRFFTEEPKFILDSEWYGRNIIFVLDENEFIKIFSEIKIPLKGSCREIKGIQILEK
jgi:hypothetical protein